VSAQNRCALSYRLLLEFTSSEQHRWREWFAAHPGAWNVPFGSGRTATVGAMVLHIFAVEKRYAERLLDLPVTEWDNFGQTSADDVFELGDDARAQVVEFLTNAKEEELDRVLTFQTLTAGTITASKHRIASNIFLHGIRHWAQIATELRQNGFADQWPHDLLLSVVEM
jgi:uncharacterized damage-inducible protein DinB